MFLKKISFLTILFFLGKLVAQQDDDFFFGKLVDAKTGEPIVFATVHLKGETLGVVSNNDGGFKVPLDFQFKGDLIVISSMGYKTKTVGFVELKKSVVNEILLTPYIYELAETVVIAKKDGKPLTKVKKRLSAKEIIKNAIERILDNYDENPFELVGYYREYQLKEKEYINLNEALIKVFDRGFGAEGFRSLEFGLYDYKPNLGFKVDSFAAKPYDYQRKDKYIPNTVFANSIVPNELVLLFNHDAIRYNNELSYSFVDVFVKDFIREHDFYTYFLTNYGDNKVYKIKFTKKSTRFEVKGDIYIDADTYAIRKLDYAVYRLNGDEDSTLNLPEADMNLLYEILVEYKEFEGLMYLNYISFHNKFELVRPPKFFMKEIIPEWVTRELKIILNKPAKNWRSLKPNDFRVYYGSSRLKVDRMTQIDATTYRLEFSKSTKSQRKKIRQFFREAKTEKKVPLLVEVNNMIDFEGSLLGEKKPESLDQFREFFTQKIVSAKNNEVDYELFVNKEIQLGNGEQPKIEVELNENFWMNTPLKSGR